MSYLNIQYGEERVPKTDFPAALVNRLDDRRGYTAKPLRLLDLGSGRGDFAEAWEKLGYEVTRVDNTDEYGSIVVDLNKDPLPFEDDTFDIVFSKSVLEHLRNPLHMLQEANRVMKDTGNALMLVPDWRTYMPIFYDDYTHIRPFDRVSLKDIMLAAGFVDPDVHEMYQYPAAWRSRPVFWAANLWRVFVPFHFAMWLHERTGIGFFKWAKLYTLVGRGY